MLTVEEAHNRLIESASRQSEGYDLLLEAHNAFARFVNTGELPLEYPVYQDAITGQQKADALLGATGKDES